MRFQEICAVRWHHFLRNPRKSYSKNSGFQHNSFCSLSSGNSLTLRRDGGRWVPDFLKLKKPGAAKPPTHYDFNLWNLSASKILVRETKGNRNCIPASPLLQWRTPGGLRGEEKHKYNCKERQLPVHKESVAVSFLVMFLLADPLDRPPHRFQLWISTRRTETTMSRSRDPVLHHI